MKFSDHLSVFKQAAGEWSDDNAPTLGAALAYYTVFSLAPLLVISIGIAGLVFGQEAAQGQIFQQLRALVGDEGGKAVQEMVQHASDAKDSSIWATIIGGVTLIFGASTVFGQLQASLNAIWGVQPKPGRGIWGLVKERVLSFGFILVVGFLLLVSLVLTAGLSFVATWMGGALPGGEVASHALNFALSLAVIAVLFAMIFKFLPDAKIAWRDVWAGASITALLFVLGKLVLGIYLGKTSVGSSFGAAGSLIVLLVWVYYSSQILFFGAELTQVYANRFGLRVEPTECRVGEQRPGDGYPSGVKSARNLMHQLADDLWVQSYPLSVLGTDHGRNVTLLRLASGQLVIHSKAPFTAADLTVSRARRAQWAGRSYATPRYLRAAGARGFPRRAVSRSARL